MNYIKENHYFDEINEIEIIQREYAFERELPIDEHFILYFLNLVQILKILGHGEFTSLVCINKRKNMLTKTDGNIVFTLDEIMKIRPAVAKFNEFISDDQHELSSFIAKGSLNDKSFSINIIPSKKKMIVSTDADNPVEFKDIELYTEQLENSLSKYERKNPEE